jgi:hypothetical protein
MCKLETVSETALTNILILFLFFFSIKLNKAKAKVTQITGGKIICGNTVRLYGTDMIS